MRTLVLKCVLAALSMSTFEYALGTSAVAIRARCAEDSLNNSQALERVLWYANCHADKIAADIFWVPAEEALDEYYLDARIAKVGNTWHATRGRIFYPSFTNADTTKVWKAPTNRNDCSVQIPAGYAWRASCISSCYTPDTKLLMAEGSTGLTLNIFDAVSEGKQSIMVVDAESNLADIALTPNVLDSYVESQIPTTHQIITFKTMSGGQLKVTNNHPLVDQNGAMRVAEDFKVGDSLITQGGDKDLIVSMDQAPYFGKVYNVWPQSENLLNNIVIAEGFLSGSAWYQNDGLNELNRKLFRSNIPTDLIEGL